MNDCGLSGESKFDVGKPDSLFTTKLFLFSFSQGENFYWHVNSISFWTMGTDLNLRQSL